MCGPLILAFPARAGGNGAHLAYHAGRLSTYAVVGTLLGSVGAGIARVGAADSLLWTARIQLGFSLLAAVFMLLFGLAKLGLIAEPRVLALANPARLPGFRRVRQRLDRPAEGGSAGASLGNLFVLGLLLGFLPCGLSFAAFTRALAAHDPLQGGLLTLVFGLGTLPSTLAVGLFGTRASAVHRRASDIIAGMLIIGMAASLLIGALA
jgi:sulfite exporter TauE/SafE